MDNKEEVKRLKSEQTENSAAKLDNESKQTVVEHRDKHEQTSTPEHISTDQIQEEVPSANEESETAELIKAKSEVQQNYQRYLRAQADLDNFRRRTMKEKETLAKYATEQLISQLLSVLDNFERALRAEQTGNETESFSTGMEMIFRQFAQILEQEGVKPMEVVGQLFNPEFHEAVMTVDTDEYETGIVVEQIQTGYMLKDKVLRPAMVKVSS